MTANCLHPGSVATGYARDGDTTGFMAWGVKVYAHLPISLTPEQGARTSVYLCSSPDVEGVTGRYFAKCKEKTPVGQRPRRGRRRPPVGRQRGPGRPAST